MTSQSPIAQASVIALSLAACAPASHGGAEAPPREEPAPPAPRPERSPDFQTGDPSKEQRPPQRPDPEGPAG